MESGAATAVSGEGAIEKVEAVCPVNTAMACSNCALATPVSMS